MPIPLLDYQIEGAEFLASRERAGLFDEPGVGKTATAIGALDRVGARRVIVVAPAATVRARGAVTTTGGKPVSTSGTAALVTEPTGLRTTTV
jgi:hypothetical protein